MEVQVFLTGQLRLEVGDVSADERHIGGRQPRLAAAFLLAERHRPVPRSELADVLWPGQLPASWEGALRGVIAKVRSFLSAAGLTGSDVLRTTHGVYQLQLPEGTVVDVEAAERALDEAERSLGRGDGDGATAAALAARAVTARPFLPAEGGSWVETKQAQLRAWHVRALLALARARLLRGEAELAARDAEEALVAEPLLETAHQLRIQALSAAGNRGAALRAYERCRRTLVDELGVGPSPETEWLYLVLLRDEPVRPLSVAPADAVTSGAGSGAILGVSTFDAFVGRVPELADIRQAWMRAHVGRRQVVLVGGEAGVGKTRLVAEAALAASHEGAIVLHGRCSEGVAAPYQPFAEAFERHAASVAIGDLRRYVGTNGGELARLVGGLAARLGDVAAPSPSSSLVEAGTERYRLFSAVSSYLSSVAAESPVVLVLDDLQWAGAPTLLLLRHLLRSLDATPVLILGTFRDDDAADPAGPEPALADALAALRRERDVERLELNGLSEGDVAALVRGAGREPDHQGLAKQLHNETDGNPFYVGELLRHLAEGGMAGSSGDLGVPEGVREVVGRRLVRLSETSRRALIVAAVVGRDFPFAVVGRVSGLSDEAALDSMDEATAARFVVEVADAPGAYRFAHALVRSAVYEAIGSTRRSRLHRQVADAVEVLAGDDVGSVAAELTGHHLAAGPAGDMDKAYEFAVRAGEVASAQLAYEDAVLHYQQAMVALGAQAEPGRLRRVLLALGAAQLLAEAPDAARGAYLQAADLARSEGDAEGLAAAALGLFGRGTHGVATWIGGDERTDLLEEAFAGLGAGDSELRVRLLSALSSMYHLSEADRPRRDALAIEAVASARRLGEPVALASALRAGRLALWGPQHTEDRLVYEDEVVELTEAAGDVEYTLYARLNRLVDLFELGDRAGVDAELTTTRALADALRQPYYSWRVAAWEALIAIVDGRFDEGEARAAEALTVRSDSTDTNAVQCYGIQLTGLRIMQGRSAEVVDMLRSAIEQYPMLPSYRCVLALCHAEAGQRTEAEAEFEHFAEHDFVEPSPDSNWATGMTALAEVCAYLGDARRAEVIHRRLAPLAGKMVVLDAFGGGGAFWGSIARSVGLLETAMGRYDQAQHSFQRALAAETRFGAPPWVNRTHLALKKVQRDTREIRR